MKVTDDLDAAVERLREDQYPPGMAGVLRINNDRSLLAAAYLRERDETPIDEAWLRACGFEPDKFGAMTKGPLHIGNINPTGAGGTRTPYACVRSYPIQDFPRTRGKLRRLCAALGIPLTEPADAR